MGWYLLLGADIVANETAPEVRITCPEEVGSSAEVGLHNLSNMKSWGDCYQDETQRHTLGKGEDGASGKYEDDW